MAPIFLIGLNRFDTNKIVFDSKVIEQVNPHRFEMRLLDGILLFKPEECLAVAYKDSRADEFWVRGHIPGRPLMPGVLMIEAAAQLASFYYKMTEGKNDQRFLGFGGVNDVKFRHTVIPGDKLIILGKCLEMRAQRRIIFASQGVVNGKLAFEATIIGMAV
jgi:3-hydroxyacyl-[acyl-carrier-protein] dehydratase